MRLNRRELLQATGSAVIGAAFAADRLGAAQAATGDDFSIENVFAGFVRDIGGSAEPRDRQHHRLAHAGGLRSRGAPRRARAGLEHDGIVVDVNVGMRSTLLDLKNPEQNRVQQRLVPRADVFVEGFRGRKMEELGFGANPIIAEIAAARVTLFAG